MIRPRPHGRATHLRVLSMRPRASQRAVLSGFRLVLGTPSRSWPPPAQRHEETDDELPRPGLAMPAGSASSEEARRRAEPRHRFTVLSQASDRWRRGVRLHAGERTHGVKGNRRADHATGARGTPQTTNRYLRMRRSTRSVRERGDARLRAAEDQRVHIVRAFVGIHNLQVDEMPDDAELVDDTVCAEHIAGDARDVERLAR